MRNFADRILQAEFKRLNLKRTEFYRAEFCAEICSTGGISL
nr:hypothetical protein [uncultured Campylobacter sp.]